MSFEKFLDDSNDIVITKKNYKAEVDKELTKFERDTEPKINLLNVKKENKISEKKIGMSIYFKEDDLMLLKAISQFNSDTVNKTLMTILGAHLKSARNSLPSDFDISKLAKEYDKNSKKKKR